MSTIRRLFSIDVIALVQDKVSTIQSSEVSILIRGFSNGIKGRYIALCPQLIEGVCYLECPLKEVLLYTIQQL